MHIADFKARYSSHFQEAGTFVFSPGRINIIGEHTDYNGGFVLPAAINHAIYVGVSKRTDTKIVLYAEDFKAYFETDIHALAPTEIGWPNYILGVVDQLIKRGYSLSGFNLYLDGDVPLGAGLSSSAAVECATGYALSELFALNLGKMEIAQIGQLAEHTFAGVNCGIMDQFASVFGKENEVVKLDCRSLAYEYVPFDITGYKIVLLNTNVKHSLGSTAYNTRREQCEAAVAAVKVKYPDVTLLRDVTVPLLDELVTDPAIYVKARFVIDEIARVTQACEALRAGDLKKLGAYMYETHEGLSQAYEVSCPELDFLVEVVKSKEAVLGARMMGGGFGGCTINLVKEEEVAALIEEVSTSYLTEFNKELTAYVVTPSPGTGKL